MKSKILLKIVLGLCLFIVPTFFIGNCEKHIDPPNISELPKLTTAVITKIDTTTATGGGTVITSTQTVTNRGIIWSITPNPTVALTTKTDDGGGLGTFTSSLINLKKNTTYYVRAYATSSVDTEYGLQVSFITKAGISPPPTTGTYYVSPTGNNSNNGSQSSPFATLAYACTKVKTVGNIIHLNAGTYIETSTSMLAVGVSIEGDSRTTTIIKSTVTSSNAFTILLSSNNSNTNGNQHISNIKLQSSTPYTAFAGIGVLNRGNVEIYNCDISNFNWYGIAFHNGEQSTAYATGNKIHDCTITNSSGYIGVYSSGDSKGSVDVLSQDGLLIYNNNITVNRTDGLNGNCIDGVGGFIKNVKIYNNTLTKIFTPSKTWDFAIEFWNIYENNEIYNNIINGSVDICRAWGKQTGQYCVWIHNNVIGQSGLNFNSQSIRGVLLEHTHNDIIIEKNYIKNVAEGVFINLGYTTNTENNLRISYNVFYNIGSLTASTGWGIYYSPEDATDRQQTTINNVQILNNVIIGASGSRWGISIPDAGKAANTTIMNNIVKGFNGSPVFGNGDNGTTINGLNITKNIFYGNGNSNNVLLYNGFSPQSYVFDEPIKVDPLFVSSTDFHLQSASPGINKGEYIISPLLLPMSSDYAGVLIGNLPEIGIHEY